MFTLDYLRKIERSDLENPAFRGDVRAQISLMLKEDAVKLKPYIIEIAEDINKIISLLEYAEIDQKKDIISSNIDVLETEIKSLIYHVKYAQRELK